MQTLNLAEAAEFLKCSEDTVLKLIHEGEINASKIGKAWVMVDIDLIESIRSKYSQHKKAKACQSTSGKMFGTRTLLSTDEELDNLLTPRTSKKRNKSMTNLKLV